MTASREGLKRAVLAALAGMDVSSAPPGVLTRRVISEIGRRNRAACPVETRKIVDRVLERDAENSREIPV